MNFTTATTNLFATVAIAFQKGLTMFDNAVLVPKGKSHSVPNKILSVALTGVAAYYCDFPVWVIGVQCFFAFLASFQSRRWFVEFATLYPFFVIGAIILQPINIITFALLVTYKTFLEVYCHIADRIIRALAELTADKAHSYYYFWVLVMVALLSATHTSSYTKGFFQGFTGN